VCGTAIGADKVLPLGRRFSSMVITWNQISFQVSPAKSSGLQTTADSLHERVRRIASEKRNRAALSYYCMQRYLSALLKRHTDWTASCAARSQMLKERAGARLKSLQLRSREARSHGGRKLHPRASTWNESCSICLDPRQGPRQRKPGLALPAHALCWASAPRAAAAVVVGGGVAHCPLVPDPC
jgi:hypothetical protein